MCIYVSMYNMYIAYMYGLGSVGLAGVVCRLST